MRREVRWYRGHLVWWEEPKRLTDEDVASLSMSEIRELCKSGRGITPEVARRLMRERMELRLSGSRRPQHDLAIRWGVAQSQVSRWLKDSRLLIDLVEPSS